MAAREQNAPLFFLKKVFFFRNEKWSERHDTEIAKSFDTSNRFVETIQLVIAFKYTKPFSNRNFK